MIFGISHDQAGILEDLLPGNALNFCSSSQDIYFNTKILSALAEESYNAICHTKYIIFDMFVKIISLQMVSSVKIATTITTRKVLTTSITA